MTSAPEELMFVVAEAASHERRLVVCEVEAGVEARRPPALTSAGGGLR
jgi:hypothetical protein